MSIADRIRECGTKVVEAGGLQWRIRKVTAEDLANHGIASAALLPEIAHMGAPGGAPSSKPEAKDGEPVPDANPLDKLARMNPAKIAQAFKHQDALVCSAVRAARDPSDPDAEWEEMRFVTAEHLADPDSNRVYISDLALNVRQSLFADVLLHNMSTEDADKLRRFRG